jgi:hypothetical protein
VFPSEGETGPLEENTSKLEIPRDLPLNRKVSREKENARRMGGGSGGRFSARVAGKLSRQTS